MTEVYGRKINDHLGEGTPLHLYLPGPHRGVWNEEALAASKEVILCESLPDRKAPTTAEVVLVWKGASPGDLKDLHQAMHAAASIARVERDGSRRRSRQRIYSTPFLWKAGKKPIRADRGPD